MYLHSLADSRQARRASARMRAACRVRGLKLRAFLQGFPSSSFYGFLKLEVPFWGPQHNKDYNVWGSILGSPYSGFRLSCDDGGSDTHLKAAMASPKPLTRLAAMGGVPDHGFTLFRWRSVMFIQFSFPPLSVMFCFV